MTHRVRNNNIAGGNQRGRSNRPNNRGRGTPAGNTRTRSNPNNRQQRYTGFPGPTGSENENRAQRSTQQRQPVAQVQQYNGESLQDTTEFPALDDVEATSRARIVKNGSNRNQLLMQARSGAQPQGTSNSYVSGNENRMQQQRSNNTENYRMENEYRNQTETSTQNNVNTYPNQLASQNRSQRQVQPRHVQSGQVDNRNKKGGRRSNAGGNKQQEASLNMPMTETQIKAGQECFQESSVISHQMVPVLFWNPDVIISPPSLPGHENMPGDSKDDDDSAFFYAYNVNNIDLPRVQRIKNQLEFYFSKKNLRSDLYLRSMMNPEGYVDYTIIRNFPRMQKLQATFQDVEQAIGESEMLECAYEPFRIRRKVNPELWTNQGLYNEIMRIYQKYLTDPRFSDWYILAEDFICDFAKNFHYRYVHPAIATSPFYNHDLPCDWSASDQLLNMRRFFPNSQPIYYFIVPQSGGDGSLDQLSLPTMQNQSPYNGIPQGLNIQLPLAVAGQSLSSVDPQANAEFFGIISGRANSASGELLSYENRVRSDMDEEELNAGMQNLSLGEHVKNNSMPDLPTSLNNKVHGTADTRSMTHNGITDNAEKVSEGNKLGPRGKDTKDLLGRGGHSGGSSNVKSTQ